MDLYAMPQVSRTSPIILICTIYTIVDGLDQYLMNFLAGAGPNSFSDDQFNLCKKRYTSLIFHLFKKFSNEPNGCFRW